MNEAPNACPRVAPKWRPRLGLIVFVALGVVLSLPLAGVFFFRIYENHLVRETEAELIAQCAVLAAIFKRDVETAAVPNSLLGNAVAPDVAPGDEPIRPFRPSLDLAADDLLPSRPAPLPPATPPDPAFLAIGAGLQPVAREAQRSTLVGFRLLDPRGVVIGGQEEIGLSLAHVEEVAAALRGRLRAVLRLRVSKHPPPPLYSISRGTGLRIFIAAPVIVRDRVTGVVYLSRTPSNVFKNLYEERGKVAAASFAIIVLALAVGFVFHRTITRPVRELIVRTCAIARGDKSARRPLEHHGTAEFAQLSQSFLDMATALESRSDYIATFAAHVSHELKSPLSSIQGAAELLRDEMDLPSPTMSAETRRKFLDNIAAAARRLTAIVNRLRELARAEQAPSDDVCCLAAAVADLATNFPKLDIRSNVNANVVPCVSGENMRIVLSHLADNAERHGATRLDIDAEIRGPVARVLVRDNGAGVSPNNRARVFDSFFTTRRDSGGTGMGLPIVRALLVAHRGEIELIPSEVGALFTLTLPLDEARHV